MIDEDELIVFQVLADRALVTDPGYVIPKLAEAVHSLLGEVERLKHNITTGRMTCDISADLRAKTGLLREMNLGHVADLQTEAADQLDDLITSLAKAETARDERQAEVERLKGQRDDVLYRMARYRADTMLGQQIRDIYNDVVYCAHEWPAQDTRLPEHKCALAEDHADAHFCWCGVASSAEVKAWSWAPPAEPGPEVRRLRPVERYSGDNGIRFDREPDNSGWRLVMMGRVGGVVEWLQIVAGAHSVYGGRQLIDATAELTSEAAR